MNTSRQRLLKAIEFTRPDKIPVIYHLSPAGLYVHGEKLLRLFHEYPPDNAIDFDCIPSPHARTLDARCKYHELSKDEWGTEWEFVTFGIQGHPKNYPFESWEAAKDYVFPPHPTLDREKMALQKSRFALISGWISIFEKLYALRPIDEVLMDLISEEPTLIRFMDRLTDYWMEAIRQMLDAGVDIIMFGDDWGTQEAPTVSPSLFRALFKPRYHALMEPIRKAGRKILFHSCGFLGPILDELIDLGIDGLWPQIGVFDHNPSFHKKCRDSKVAIYIHPDRQRLIPLGTPEEIETAIKDYADVYHALGGGGIFYIEIENDAPFENVRTLIEAVNKWR